MYGFLNKEDGVSYLSLRYEASLVVLDEIMEMRFKTSGQNFSDELIGGVAKGDGPKSRKGGRAVFFRDKGKECRVSVPLKFFLVLGPMYHFHKILFNKIPICSIKGDRKPIWSKSFIRMQGPNCILDLFFINFSVEIVVYLFSD